MPNSAEEELRALHSTIGQIKRTMKHCKNEETYKKLEAQLNEFEEMRVKLLKKMEVKI